jgi:hypothetical protein
VGNAFDGNLYAEGGTFVPGANANFGSVSVALSCPFGCPAAENFTITLTRTRQVSPAPLSRASNFGPVLAGLGAINAPVTATSFLTPLLTAGTRYWIAVTTSIAFSIAWNQNSTSDSSIEALSADGGATWFSPSIQTPGAFEVDSTTGTTLPEPGAAILLSAGLGMALLVQTSGCLTFLLPHSVYKGRTGQISPLKREISLINSINLPSDSAVSPPFSSD